MFGADAQKDGRNQRQIDHEHKYAHTLYPEDMKIQKDAVQFTEDFKHLDAAIHPSADVDEEFGPNKFNEHPDKADRIYKHGPTESSQNPLLPGDSKIWGKL